MVKAYEDMEQGKMVEGAKYMVFPVAMLYLPVILQIKLIPTKLYFNPVAYQQRINSVYCIHYVLQQY